MANEIISYVEACAREGGTLQKGMNYRRGKDYSVVIMSLRPNAPYEDRVEEDGATLIYEGHDTPKSDKTPVPKLIDQPQYTPSGKPTENGKFYRAAQDYKQGVRSPERVKVYEIIKPGIWSYNGLFELVDSWQQSDGQRQVFKFKLRALEDDPSSSHTGETHSEQRRIIPTSVKLAVWKRDSGRCTICGSKRDLHFDHVIPYSKGGSSSTAENIQLLCSKHNLEKKDHIQ